MHEPTDVNYVHVDDPNRVDSTTELTTTPAVDASPTVMYIPAAPVDFAIVGENGKVTQQTTYPATAEGLMMKAQRQLAAMKLINRMLGGSTEARRSMNARTLRAKVKKNRKRSKAAKQSRKANRG